MIVYDDIESPSGGKTVKNKLSRRKVGGLAVVCVFPYLHQRNDSRSTAYFNGVFLGVSLRSEQCERKPKFGPSPACARADGQMSSATWSTK